MNNQPFGAIYTERSRSAQGEKGAIVPLLVIILLIIGIVVGTKLVDLPQIFKSRASAPVTLPTPVFEDDFSTNAGWELLEQKYPEWRSGSIGEYLANEGLIRILITRNRDIGYLQKRINITDEFSAIFDFTPKGQSVAYSVGFYFGGPGRSNVYRFFVKSEGGVGVFYWNDNIKSLIFQSYTGVKLLDNKTYKLRLDRRLNELKAWLSEDNGISWKSIAQIPLHPGAGIGADGAMYMGFIAYADSFGDVGQIYPEARFDNFKVWRLGQVPEPVEVTSSSVTACGKTGVLAPDYQLLSPSSCIDGQYLYVNVEGRYLTNACLAVPPGNTKTADGCSYAVTPPTLASLNPTPNSGTSISNTDTITVSATVNDGDRFDIWVDWKCFVTTSLSGQTYGFTLAEIADRSGNPECKSAGSHTVHVAPIRGAGGIVGQSNGATYTVRPVF